MKHLTSTLRFLKITQEANNIKRLEAGLKKLGKKPGKVHRMNPYNPLSYLVLALFLIVGIILFGFYGLFKDTVTYNPFKWH